VSGWASLPSVPDADLERRVEPRIERDDPERLEEVAEELDEETERPAGTRTGEEPTPDLHDTRNRDNWRTENWHIP
jgi:hypothetical protein